MSARPREPPVPSATRLIRLLATESSGAILRALDAGPLRSAQLTDRLAEYSRRTIYRRLDELEQIRAVEQRRSATVPPAVAYELTVPAGRELLGVLEGAARAWLHQWHQGSVNEQRWGLLSLLADGWDSAIMREVSREPRSLTELGVVSEMTYHQLARRVTRLAAAGLLERINGVRPVRYTLSEQARLGAILVAASARWERRHLLGGAEQLLVADAIALLRTILPLARLPEQAGATLVLTVQTDAAPAGPRRYGSVRIEVDDDGEIHCAERGDLPPDAWARGSIDAWLLAIIEGDGSDLQVGGEHTLVEGQLGHLRAQTAPVASVSQ